MGRFLFNGNDRLAVLGEFRHSEALGVRNIFQQNERSRIDADKAFDEGLDGTRKYIVPENDATMRLPDKILAKPQGLRDSARFVLNAIGESALILPTRSKQVHNRPHVLGTRDNHDVVDAGFEHLIDRMQDHGLFAHR